MENTNTFAVIGAVATGLLIGTTIHAIVNPIVTKIKDSIKEKRQTRKIIERRLNALKEI
jgi:hypothetical protein